MPRIPFATQSYVLDSLPASAQRLVNLYAERMEGPGRSDVLVRHVPGTVLFATVGLSKVWAGVQLGVNAYVVTGGFPNFVVHKVTPNGVVSTIGTITDGSSPITMAVISGQIAICTAPWGYIVASDVLTKITDGDFPSVTSVCAIDGYFIWTKQNADQYVISGLLNGMVYDALDFAGAESVPDSLLRCVEDHGELVLFGSRSIEVHHNTGNPDFPFQPQPGGRIDVGTRAMLSVAKVDNTVMWLGSDLIVYRRTGYQRERISTHAIEKEIQSFTQPELAQGFNVSFQGHDMYVLTFSATVNSNQGPGRTYIYDAATRLWHERASAPGDLWDVAMSMRFGNRVIVGGAGNGNLFYLDADVTTENGTALTAIATLPPLWADGGLATLHRLELEMETGANDTELNVSLDWSDDGGITYSVTPLARSMGAENQTTKRVIWTRLGKFRQRVLRFTFPAGAELSLYGANVQANGTRG